MNIIGSTEIASCEGSYFYKIGTAEFFDVDWDDLALAARAIYEREL